MLKKLVFILLFITAGTVKSEYSVQFPEFVIEGIESEIIIQSSTEIASAKITVNDSSFTTQFTNKQSIIPINLTKDSDITVTVGSQSFKKHLSPIPLWMSILPPLLAIVMALFFKEVISSLLIGLFFGAFTIEYYQSGFLSGIIEAFKKIIDTYIIGALNNWDHLAVIIFSTLIGGMVALISKNGGMRGVVNIISRYANTPKSGQFATWVLGVAIFFDDYANTLVVGHTMRSITDKLKISREKLSYLVDSTAAPVAAIAFVTTWIGAELGYISNGIENIPEINKTEGPYSIFFHSLSYSFYPVFTLIFMLFLIWKGKDFGPMYKAEHRARTTGHISSQMAKIDNEIIDESELDTFEPVSGIQHRWYNAVIPVVVVIAGTIIGLLYTGSQGNEGVWHDTSIGFFKKLSIVIGNADSYSALLWSSLGGVFTALLLTLGQKILSLSDSIESILAGFKTMMNAMIILILAWSLAEITDLLHTADFITNLLAGHVTPVFIPTVTFVLAALVAFSTGSSWGTMAILYPLMLPAAWNVGIEAGMEQAAIMPIFYNVVASVLAGSVLGDHCSPISDTTILSSLASSCNHIDHVKTQMPYALTVGGVAIFLGTLPAAWGISSFILFPAGIIILYLIVTYFGKSVDN